MTALPMAVSLGDPAGIGPQIVAQALAARPEVDVVVFGDLDVMRAAGRRVGIEVPAARVRTVDVAGGGAIVPGTPNLASARAQLAYLEAATAAALAGEVSALCTAPISKEWISRAGFEFPGHTEYLAARTGVPEHAMMLAGPSLRVVLASTHIALADVPRLVSAKDIARAAVLAARALTADFGVARARIAVAGLNPHAGEAGKFGDEEARVVAPGIALARERLRAEGVDADVSGPYPPDAVFREAAIGGFDAVVALYHDQGLIPVKLLHFHEAVNITLGLPFVRTSPDHGTAYSLVESGQANPASMLAALDLAHRITAIRGTRR